MKKIIAAFAASAMLVAQMTQAFAYMPSGFEIAGWTSSKGGTSSSFTIDTQTKNSGVASYLATTGVGTSNNVQVYQIVEGLEPSTQYEFSFYSKGENVTYLQTVRNNSYVTDIAAEVEDDYDWVKMTQTFTTLETGTYSTKAQFRFKIGNRGSEVQKIWIDDCSLVKTGTTENLITNPGFEDGVDVTAPEAITDLMAEVIDSSATFTWTDSVTDDFTGVAVYKDGEYVTTVSRGVEEYEATGLTNGTAYTYSFKATDAWKNESAAAELTVKPDVPREAPEVSADDENNVVVGIAEGMEYSLDGGAWTAYTAGAKLNLVGAHIIKIRYAKTDELNVGLSKTLIFYTNKAPVSEDLSAELSMDFDKVSVKGLANDDKVTLLVQKADSAAYEDVVYFRELDITNKAFEKTFTMPESAERATYKAVISAQQFTKQVSLTFSYVPDDEIERFASDAKGNSALLLNEENSDVLETVGITPSDFYDNASAGKVAAALAEIDEPTSVDFARIAAFHTTIGMVKNASNAASGVEAIDKYAKFLVKDEDGEKIGLVFEDEEWSEIEDIDKKAWVAAEFKNTAMSNLEQMQEEYERLNIFYLINSGSYANIETVMEEYAEEMGLEDSSAYSSFKKLSKANKAKVLKAVKEANDSYRDFEKFAEKLATEVKKVSKSSSSSSDGDSKPYSPQSSYSPNKDTGLLTTVSDKTDPNVSGEKKIFDDLDGVEWAVEAIESLYKIGAVSGMEEGVFNPNGIVTREQIAKMVVDTFGIKMSEPCDDFSDVSSDRWSYEAIKFMKSNNIIAGYDDGSFKPADEITRQDLAVILVKVCELMDIKLKATRDDATLADESEISDYAKESITKLYMAEILNGTDAGVISPKGKATRAMAAQLIYTLFKEVV